MLPNIYRLYKRKLNATPLRREDTNLTGFHSYLHNQEQSYDENVIYYILSKGWYRSLTNLIGRTFMLLKSSTFHCFLSFLSPCLSLALFFFFSFLYLLILIFAVVPDSLSLAPIQKHNYIKMSSTPIHICIFKHTYIYIIWSSWSSYVTVAFPKWTPDWASWGLMNLLLTIAHNSDLLNSFPSEI